MSKKLLSLSIILMYGFLLLGFTSCKLSDYEAKPAQVYANTMIAHAGGGIEGEPNYLNTLASFEEHYAANTRIFEYDFVLSEDNELIGIHKWENNVIGEEYSKSNRPTLAEYKAIKIAGKYEGICFDDILELMLDYPDIVIAFDTKETNYVEVIQKLVDDTIAYDISLLDRIIPFLYNLGMYDEVEEIYSFDYYIFLVNSTNDNYSLMTNDEIYEHLASHDKIIGLALSTWRMSIYNNKQLNDVNALGKRIFSFLFNDLDDIEPYLDKGISGFVSDYITEDEYDDWYKAEYE